MYDLYYMSSTIETARLPSAIEDVVQPCNAHVGRLWAPIPVFFEAHALGTIVRVRHAVCTADHAPPAVRTKVALVADTNDRGWAHVGVTERAFSVTPLTQPADSYTGNLAAQEKIRMVPGLVARTTYLDMLRRQVSQWRSRTASRERNEGRRTHVPRDEICHPASQ